MIPWIVMAFGGVCGGSITKGPEPTRHAPMKAIRESNEGRWLCTSSLVAEERFSFLARQRFLHHDALHPTRSKTICKYDELVKDSGNHARSAAQHCQSADPGDRSRLHHQHPYNWRVLLRGHVSEGSRGRAWRQNCHPDTVGLEFRMQRFAKQQYVPLARGISCVTGYRLISEKAGDQKDMTCSTFHHVCRENVRELGHGENVKLQHIDRSVQRLIDERSIEAITSIIYQDVHSDAACIKARLQLRSSPSERQIYSFDHDVDMMLLAEQLGQSLHRFRATCSQ